MAGHTDYSVQSVMSSKSLVDPDLAPFLDTFPTVRFSADILPLIRARAMPYPGEAAGAGLVDLEELDVPGPAGAPAVPVRIYRPHGAGGGLPCVLHIHGGGYVTGSAAMLEAVHTGLALKLNCLIVSVDYRLAPETHYPGALEDCYAALAWVAGGASALGGDPGRVGVMGESAGGGLAAGLALLARDRGEYPLAFQHLIYPMLDDRTCVVSEANPYTGEYIWTRQSNAFGWSSLLGVTPGSEGVSSYAAPGRADDLRGLPPAYIAVGALDLFLEEDIAFASRLARQGVPVELHVYPGAFHGFDLAPNAGVAEAARLDSVSSLRRALYPGK